MNKTFRKILNIVVDVLIILVLLISATVLIVTLTTSREGKGVPNIFGKAPVSVLTPSMQGDKADDFNAGDLLICDVVDGKGTNFKVGDVVTFRAVDFDGDGKEDLLTHRLYKQNEDGSFQTKGDANSSYDQDPNVPPQLGNVYPADILAVYHGTKISGFGNVMYFLRSPQGFFFCILLPMIIFFIYQAVRVIMNAMAYSKEKGRLQAEEAINNSELTEEQKAKAIAEYLASQKEQLNEKAAEAETPPGDSENT